MGRAKKGSTKKAKKVAAEPEAVTHLTFAAPRRILMIGCGAIGGGLIPLLLRHVKVDSDRILVVSANKAEAARCKELGVAWKFMQLLEDNYEAQLRPLLNKDDLCLNMSSCVSSLAIIKLCQSMEVLYIDSSNETWDDSPEVLHLTWGRYVAKEQTLTKTPGMPTALISHGANPGLVQHFTKAAIMEIARDEYGKNTPTPKSREQWAELACKLQIQTIQISERDTQLSSIVREPGQFCCTWCVSAMMDEASEPSQVPLGTHEPAQPITNRPDSEVKHDPATPPTWFSGNFAGNNTVRSWNPVTGEFMGNLIPHDETFSMSKYFATADGKYRPTVYFAYQPSNDSILSLRDWFSRYPKEPSMQRLMLDDITQGQDILGVLVARKDSDRVMWYGSLLSINEARERLPHTSATTLSVIASVLAGICWVVNNPRAGFVEPDDIDHEAILKIALPYIEPMTSTFGKWTPLENCATAPDMWCLKHAMTDGK